jgi:effector-binding domain-containing protein
MLAALAVTVLALYSGAALAHCGVCGVGEPSVHGEMEGHGEMGALPEGHVMQMPLECPGGCGMSGGLCGGCAPHAEAMLREMAVEYCPNCEEPDALCELCETGVGGAMEVLTEGMAPVIATAPAHEIAFVEGTLGGDIAGLFGQLMGSVMEQDLISEQTHVGGVCPYALSSEGFNPETTYYAGINIPPDAEVSAPLGVYEVPGGVYMMVDHVGPYEMLSATWMAAFTYAELQNIMIGDGPCGEHYVSDPETTPQEELLTQIFIPVVGHTDGRGEMPEGHPQMDGDPHAGHGHG